MDPNQPYAPPPQNQYDFITNPGQPPKKSLIPGDNSFLKRILIVVGGAFVFMLVAGIIISLLTSGNGGPTQAMTELAEEQQNIILLSTDGASNAMGTDTRSLAITSQLSVQTDQTKTITYLQSTGTKIDAKKQLPLALDSKTAETLETARSSNRYDEVFNEMLSTKLAQYRINLKKAYDSTSSENAKTVLENSFESASNLVNAKE